MMAGEKQILTVEKVFRDYLGRRNGLRKALTTQRDELLEECDPESYEYLCLFGYANEKWEVTESSVSKPPRYPQPMMGIKSDRDKSNHDEWLLKVAHRSDAWLLGLAFFLAAESDFDKEKRKQLFQQINNLSTLSETVREDQAKKKSKEKASTSSISLELERNSEERKSSLNLRRKVAKYQKPPSRECPFTSAGKPCPYGMTCRFSRTHKDGTSNDKVDFTEIDSEVNVLKEDVQKLHWKNMPKPDNALRKLRLRFALEKAINETMAKIFPLDEPGMEDENDEGSGDTQQYGASEQDEGSRDKLEEENKDAPNGSCNQK